MESIRSIIKERIKSCISCNENQCPIIKERLDHHVLSHHSTTSRPRSYQQTEYHHKPSGLQIQSESNISIVKLEEQTSTSDLSLNQLSKHKTNYKEDLKELLLEWSNSLPIIQDQENVKQNLMNELLEKIYELYSEINDKYYDLKLSKEIDNVLKSIRADADDELDMYTLREIFLNKIHDLNKKVMNSDVKLTKHKNKSGVIRSKTNNIAVSTPNHKNKVESPKPQHSDTGTQISSVDIPIEESMDKYENIKIRDRKFVDTQIQNSLTNIIPLYKSIYEDTILQEDIEKNNSSSNIFKRKLLDWILELRNEGIINLESKNLVFLVEDFFNRVQPILQTETYISDSKILLRGEILNFLMKNIDTSLSTANMAHLNKLAESLAITLLIEKNNRMVQSVFCQNRINKEFGINNKENMIIFRSIYDTVVNALVNHEIYSDRLINDMTKCIFENRGSINVNSNQHLKKQLSMILKKFTGLSEYDVDTIIEDIVDASVTENNYFDLKENINEYDDHHDNVISVYNSELEMGQSNPSNTSTNQRRSRILKKKNSKLQTGERKYMKDITAVIKTWLDTLPVDLHISKNKKDRDTFADNLSTDILDQVKLDNLAEVSNEKDKYVSFFIYRWLNRLKYFENINEAKPFVDQLVGMLKGIPEPPRKKSYNKPLSSTNTNSNSPSYSEKTFKERLKVLKDEITSLLNLPPNMILVKDNTDKTKFINDFLLIIQNLITEKKTMNDISKEIDIWLKGIINSEEKQTILKLSKKIIESVKKNLGSDLNTGSTSSIDNKTETTESILKDYIAKYLEHSYDSEDSIARDAFSQLLKNELHKLSSSLDLTNGDLTKNYQQEEAIIEKLSKELEYINLITDWLKTLPLQDSFNQINRRVLALLINKLARDINDLDENTMRASNENEYYNNLIVIINQFLEQLPISHHHRRNVNSIIDNLITKLVLLKKTDMCCQFTKQTLIAPSENITNHNLTNLIEEYIRNNSDKISEDHLKLEAYILRFLELMDKKEVENFTAQIKSQVSNQVNKTKSQNETARRFSFTLGYANEISQWLKNIPLQPINDKKLQHQIADMISTLAEKLSETQIDYKELSEIDSSLVDYITNWVNALPLDSSKEIILPVAVQQLLNRIARVDINKHQSYKDKEDTGKNNFSSKMCKYSHACCNKNLENNDEDNLGIVVINEIEKWCSNLPIESDNEDTDRELKQNIATKLYQKVGELNMNREYFNNNLLYQELLGEEIQKILNNLPQNSILETVKDELKKKLLKAVTDKRSEIKERTSAIEYKHDLERTIEMSMPFPVPIYQEDSPGFKMYKDRLAAIFILENFDHGDDAVKLKYVNKIKKEIDKYFKYAQMRNYIPLTKENIYNELYSALFSVPLPIETSITAEVEEIKTRCEIDDWFETLPLREANGVRELLEWDQILAMLAKRLCAMEKHKQHRDDKMHKEISKWLLRLPLLPGEETNIDIFTRDLLKRLKKSQQDRKYVSRDMNTSYQTTASHKIENKGILATSQVAASSKDKEVWYTPPSYSLPSCCRATIAQDVKKPADTIIEIVEDWCRKLPMPANTMQEKENIKVMKENITIRIIMKISELNMNPETFEDEFLYNSLLDDELENLLNTLPLSYEFQENKDTIKCQLINAIKDVHPLIREEKARYDYRRDIKNTIDNVLKTPQNQNDVTRTALASLSDEIADSYIVYHYHKYDNKGTQMKEKMYNSVEKYFSLVQCEDSYTTTKPFDLLMKRNQLLCELSKISTPSESIIIKELKEIDMKLEITKFFNELSLPQNIDKIVIKNQIKVTLAKRLTDFDNIGYTTENCHKIKTEIIKCLKKIDENIEIEKVDSFIQSLKSTQPNRISIYEKSGIRSPNFYTHNVQKQNLISLNEKDDASLGITQSNLTNQNTRNEQWLSLLPVTPESEKLKEVGQDKYYSSRNSTSSLKKNENGLVISPMNKEQPIQSFRSKNDQSTFDQNRINSCDTTIHGLDSANQNYLQQQTSQSEISKLSDPNYLRGHNMQDIKSLPSQYKPTYPQSSQSSSTQDYMRHQDESSNQIEPSPFLQHHIQSNEISQPVPSRPVEDSFQQTPLTDLEPNQYADSHILKRQNSAALSSVVVPRTEQISNDISMPLPSTVRISEKPISHPNIRRTCRRPSITIFSPSYLEPDESQKEKSRPEISKEEDIQCSCVNKNKQVQNSRGCVHRKKYCRFCNRVHPFYCGMYRYPSYYFY